VKQATLQAVSEAKLRQALDYYEGQRPAWMGNLAGSSKRSARPPSSVVRRRRASVAWFRCFIRGENFPGQLIGEPGLVGFYVTRFVEAVDVAAAESIALRALRAEPKLAAPPGHTPTGRARVFFEYLE
jgi:hypothetical protein